MDLKSSSTPQYTELDVRAGNTLLGKVTFETMKPGSMVRDSEGKSYVVNGSRALVRCDEQGQPFAKLTKAEKKRFKRDRARRHRR
jgi:hypothetical protein